MAHLLRLIVVGLLLMAGQVHALLPSPSPVWQYRYDSTFAWGNDATAACAAGALKANNASSVYYITSNGPATFTGGRYTQCSLKYVDRSNGQTVTAASLVGLQSQQVAGTCPANSTAVTGGCQCNATFTESGGACVDPDTASCSSLAGKPAGMKNWEGQADSFSFCDAYASSGGTSVGGGKCVATASKAISWQSPPDSGHWISQGEATYSGGKATTCAGSGGTGTDPAPSSPTGADGKPPLTPGNGQAAPSPCPEGQAPGEVNGTRVCAPVGPDVKATDKKEVVNPDGSKNAETRNTECKDGTCTSNTQTCTTPAGSSTPTCTTSTSSQGQGVYCNANKGSKACTGTGTSGGGSFGGDCAAGFKADGEDPVLNAMALEQYKRNCEVLSKTSTESVAVGVLLDAAGTTKATNPNDSAVTIGSSNFDTSDALGGGSCNLNKTITVAKMTATLPLNVLCDPLAVLGQLLVAVSLLLAVRIVTRG